MIQMRLGLNSLADLAPRITDAADAEMADAAEELEFLAKDLAAVDTGEMQSKIHVVRISYLAFQVRADAAHSAFVEYGTSRMAAQPFITPAMETIKASYERRIANAIQRNALG